MDSAFTCSNVPALGSLELQNFKPYIPEEFANFEIYNASLETQEGALCARSELTSGIGMLSGTRAAEKEVSRSPTASSCTSGYFSHSASNATLSDVLFSGSDSCDQLNIREPTDSQEHGKGCHSSRSASGFCPAQIIPSQPYSHYLTDRDCSPSPPRKSMLSISQEFTDFKGADDGVEEDDLGHFACKAESASQDKTQDKSSPSKCRLHNGKDEESVPHVPPEATREIESLEDPELFKGADDGLVEDDLGSFGCKAESVPQAKIQDKSSPSQCHLHNGKQFSGDSVPHVQPEATQEIESFEDPELLEDSSEDENAPVAQLPDWMAPGEQVWVGKQSGMVHYVGGVEFAKGIWVGVELDLAVGKHNGTVKGRVYFRCATGHGVFVKPSRLTRGPPSIDTESQHVFQ